MAAVPSPGGRAPAVRARTAGAAVALLVGVPALWASPAAAFSVTEHRGVVSDAWSFMPSGVIADVADEHLQADTVNAADSSMHVDGCDFSGSSNRIRSEYAAALGTMNPSSPDLWQAVDDLGFLSHPVMDFYAHSNWVELGTGTVLDSGTGAWPALSPWGSPAAGIVTVEGETPPSGWSLSLPQGSRIPTVTRADGSQARGLMTGTFGLADNCPDNVSLGHGDLNKDDSSRTGFAQARALAVQQMRHEWCRTLNLATSRYGLAGAGLPLALWVRPGASPHPPGTACATSTSGSVRVQVSITALQVSDDTDPLGSGELNFALALFSGSLQRSTRSVSGPVGVSSGSAVGAGSRPAAVSLCMAPTDQVGISLHGWDDDEVSLSANGVFERGDEVLRGGTVTASSASAAAGSRTITGGHLSATLSVTTTAGC